MEIVLIYLQANFSSGQNVDRIEQKGGPYKYGSNGDLVISGGRLWAK
ncbi:MAG: hypothetical protein GY775_15470 [Candidatus Scalindua sp.]|nr:hypothetical protein [Candidatus Scalindua sp.]